MQWMTRDDYIGTRHNMAALSNWHVAVRPSDIQDAVIGVYQKDGKWWVFTGAARDYEIVLEVTTLEEAKAYAEISYRMQYNQT